MNKQEAQVDLQTPVSKHNSETSYVNKSKSQMQQQGGWPANRQVI